MNVKSNTESTLTEKVSILIRDHRKYLIIASVFFVLILVAIGAVEYRSNKKAEKSVQAAEQIESVLQDYLGAAEEDKAELKDELTALIADSKTNYKNLYAHMRGLYAEAQILADSEDWAGSAAAYKALADNFATSYIAPVALINAAAMEEEAGDIEEAISLLERTIADYKDVSAAIPEVLFNLGRLSEGLGDGSKAEEYYNRISEEYGSSNWNNLAKSRIIAIKYGS
ncbi:tetratricopeptide repeat protein [Oceanispirochaeta crateris]|uniref:Tetratricopeptide repeat protein n=1 Tax=Oceanispirochaeta crateris TaxID=2518645 RepID=A0A5C1QJR6_9SPIO|nr:tetratricopeptide repeat protein [Oceanispirochaeta crateris]QEN07568.1 tetratricopeptide repeat protein [Oceanispirochaeta crateris]